MAAHSGNMSLSKWPIFSLLEEEFLQTLKLVCVFGSSGNEAILVTHDDEVYSLGSNNNGCLGVGDTRSTFNPRMIRELSKKGVVDITYGSGPHVVAMVASGELYSWGSDSYGQLGQGVLINTTVGAVPRQIRGNLERVKVVQVACGGHHTLALTAEGQVFSWGFNNSGQIGSGNTLNQILPRRVEGLLSQVTCSAVCCSNASSIVLSESGDLFSWGYNGNGQLGVGSNTSHSTPCRVHMEKGITVKQAVCGHAHILCLSDRGELYAWGSNMYGQLGTGTKNNLLVPTRVAENLGSFMQVAACHNNHISGASLLTGKVYMWGLCRGQNILSPLSPNLGRWTTSLLTLAPRLQCGELLYQSTSDLTITVEGQKIHVHRAILQMRCEYFQAMFSQGRWKEAEKNCIEISQFPYPVYHAFLKYLYTDKLEPLSTEDMLGLLELADSYCEKELKKLCERLIWQSVTVDNVATLMTLASKYSTSTLEEQCVGFALNHMTQVIQSEAFDQLDCLLAKSFIKRAAEKGAFRT